MSSLKASRRAFFGLVGLGRVEVDVALDVGGATVVDRHDDLAEVRGGEAVLLRHRADVLRQFRNAGVEVVTEDVLGIALEVITVGDVPGLGELLVDQAHQFALHRLAAQLGGVIRREVRPHVHQFLVVFVGDHRQPRRQLGHEGLGLGRAFWRGAPRGTAR